MPSHSRKTSSNVKAQPEATDPHDPNSLPLNLETETPRAGRKKTRNALPYQPAHEEPADDVLETEVTQEYQSSPRQHISSFDQIPRSFPHRTKPDVHSVEELSRTEKVADESTPPQEAWNSYGRTPPELVPGLTQAVSPQLPYSQVGKGGFNTRSPPTSPPQLKSRPLSYGGPPTSHLAYQRASPYVQPSTAYGSPPALPHLPQPHFYNAQDVDVGLFPQRSSTTSEPPNILKFAKLPGSQQAKRETILAGGIERLDVLRFQNDRLEHKFTLHQLPGRVEDAVFLPWNHGPDPFESLRPLIALSISGYATTEQVQGDRPVSHHSAYDTSAAHPYGSAVVTEQRPTITVSVYSLKNSSLIAELLHVPIDQSTSYATRVPVQENPCIGHVALQASGNHLLVSLSVSGEAYVFTAGVHDEQPQFECSTKVWTSLQPRLLRRDSSHARSGEQQKSPASVNKEQPFERQPICTLNGRFLAYCPASSSRDSLGAVISAKVVNRTTITGSRTAPSRPSISCEVESPDTPTLLGKVAKGVAQEIVRGSKWIGEKGMQAWNSYWNTDSATSMSTHPAHGRTFSQPVQLTASPFPPTHGDSADAAAREPELISIVDLIASQNTDTKLSEVVAPFATFQPLGGCSFLSFMPNGLGLLTASSNGDTYYIWDLFQIRYPRTTLESLEATTGSFTARVRQVTKYERMSSSTIVDVEWDEPQGSRFAILTQNRTIHMYDLPKNALRWPPPRQRKIKRPMSAPVEPPITQTTGGFFATAKNYASQAPPLFANLRGRAPSMSVGVSGIGAQASATGMRSGQVVAAGFSKSLGAASDTVANIRHAGQSKLHLKIEAVPGRLSWHSKDQKPVLSILDTNGVRDYFVRKTNPRDGKVLETVSVFEARKPVGVKLPPLLTLDSGDITVAEGQKWVSPRSTRGHEFAAPLSFAEIETNAPYQPFHSDNRVTMSVYADDGGMKESTLPTASLLLQPQPSRNKIRTPRQWVFGDDIPTVKLDLGLAASGKHNTWQYESAVYRETTVEPADGHDGMEQVVSTTKRRTKRPPGGDDEQEGNEEGFFEDDTVVLDYAEDRV